MHILKVSEERAKDIEKLTRGQADNKRWFWSGSGGSQLRDLGRYLESLQGGRSGSYANPLPAQKC